MLNNALDYGITEKDFWSMTIAELERAIDSKERLRKLEAKEKATFDYIHASLVGSAISRVLSSGASYPEIHEAYPTIFTENKQKEIDKQERINQLSILRFKQFAQSYNKKFEEVAKGK